MRGFPLLNVLIVVAFFAVAWWPLQRLTGQAAAGVGASAEGGEAVGNGENFTIRVMSSHPLETLSLAHLGQPMLIIDDPGAESEFEHSIEGVEIPPEGVEFWVEAGLAGATGEHQRPAIQLELTPEDLERGPRTVTLWGQPDESKIEAPAVFQWPGDSSAR
ncbi:MAG: hypothetical protein ACR2RV_10115 [Verrucomicrobiales bacterium]